jgi:molecular chaperone GrpE
VATVSPTVGHLSLALPFADLSFRDFSTGTSTEKTSEGEDKDAQARNEGVTVDEPKADPAGAEDSKTDPGATKKPEKDAATLATELEAALLESKKYKNELAYALADIDNVRKIAKKDVSNAREYALKEFSKDLLDVSDTLDRALSIFPAEAKKDGHPSNSIFIGIEMTVSAMRKVMEKHGITRMEIFTNETEFDPNFHMAIYQQPVPNMASGIIINEVKPGFMIKNRVLRPANVGVSSDAE